MKEQKKGNREVACLATETALWVVLGTFQLDYSSPLRTTIWLSFFFIILLHKRGVSEYKWILPRKNEKWMFFERWVYRLFCHLTRGYVQRVRVRPDIFLYRLTVGTAPSHLSQGWRISLIIRREGDGVVGPHWLVLVLFFFFFFNQHV